MSSVGFTLNSQRLPADPGYHYAPVAPNDPNAKIYNWGPSGDTAKGGGPGSTGRWASYRFATGTGNGTPGGGGATASSDMYMGTSPTLDKQNTEFNCTGWLEMGPGVKVLKPDYPDVPSNYVREDGNNFVLDCADDEISNSNPNNTNTMQNQFWISNVDTPRVDSTYGGHWSLDVYVFNTSGQNVHEVSIDNLSANPESFTNKPFYATNGMNTRIELQWHANGPPQPKEGLKCNEFTTTASKYVRKEVHIDGVSDGPGALYLNGSSTPTTTWTHSANFDEYDPAPVGQNVDPGTYTKTWDYHATSNIITVTVNEWDYNGSSWPETSNTYQVPCYSASCSIQWVDGDGPWDGSYNPDGSQHDVVVAGGTIHVHGTFTDNGTTDGPNYMAAGAYLDGPDGTHNLGFVPYSGYSYPFDIDIPAPNAVTTYNTSFTPQYNASEQNMNGCPMSTDTYAHFDASVTASSQLSPTTEHPTGGDNYSTKITVDNNYSHTVTIPTSSSFYMLTPSGAQTNIAGNGGGTYGSAPWDPGGPGATTTTLSGHYDIPSGSYDGGYEYCASIYAGYTSGYVGPSSNVVGGQNPQTSTNCPRIANEPYFKTLNSSIAAGGDFDQCTNAGGLLAGYNDIQSDPGGRVPADRGASSQLSSLALLKITGVASAQSPGTITRSPTDLTFANKGVQVDSSGMESPVLGGSFGSCQQLTNETAPSNATNIVGPSTAANRASGAYTHNGDLRITNGSFGKSKNVSMFVNGNVYIDGNIDYNQVPGWTTGTVPSFVLHATGNIYIDPTVTSLAGLYIAQQDGSGNGGKIYTCSDSSGYAPMAAKNLYSCNNQLVIYGSFVADQVNLMRTYGSLRDEEPNASTPGGATIGLCWTTAWYISPACHDPSERCTLIDEPSDPDTWNDNVLCVPASSSLKIAWTHYDNNPGTGDWTNPSSGWAPLSVLHAAGYTYCTKWDVPPDYAQTWYDNELCMNQARSDGSPLLHFVSNPNQDPGSSCTTINESSDPDGQWASPGYFLCQPFSNPTPPTPKGPPYNTCSNQGTESDSNSCAAEVFEFSPELYMAGNGIVTPPSNGALQYQALTSLPPVL